MILVFYSFSVSVIFTVIISELAPIILLFRLNIKEKMCSATDITFDVLQLMTLIKFDLKKLYSVSLSLTPIIKIS